MMPPQCDCPAPTPHALGPHYLMLVGPGGAYRRYCDARCVLAHLTAEISA